MQSAGSSGKHYTYSCLVRVAILYNSLLGTTSFGYAVVSDIATPSERGAFVGAVLIGPNVAPSLEPVLGGAHVSYVGWC
jgi:hypothetical protein